MKPNQLSQNLGIEADTIFSYFIGRWRPFVFTTIFLSVLFCHPRIALAQAGNHREVLPPRSITGFNLAIDQDAFFVVEDLNEDQNYTMGLSLAWTGIGTNRTYLVTPLLLNGLDALTLDFIWSKRGLSRGNMQVTSFNFGFSGFTPKDLASAGIVYDDRPYSSTMYFQSGRVYHSDLNENLAVATSFGLHVLGTHVGKSVQSAIHYLQSSTDESGAPITGSARPIPKGWGHQIGNGGGISAQYSYDLLYRPFENGAFDHNFHAIAGLDAGLYTNLNTGFGLMLGNVLRPWYLPINQNAGTDQKKAKEAAVESFAEKKGQEKIEAGTDMSFHPYGIRKPVLWEAFVKIECRGFLWAENGLLTGTTVIGPKPFDVRDENSEVKMSRTTVEAFAALVLRLNYLEVSYGVKYRSNELNYLDTTRDDFRSHFWGQIAVGWRL